MKEFEALINADKPVLVDFYADWCDPCKWLVPILDEVKKNISHKGNIIKINIEEQEELKNLYDIRSVPTLILFKNGKVEWRMNGFKTAPELTKIIEEYY
jgi:thioredoxin 1